MLKNHVGFAFFFSPEALYHFREVRGSHIPSAASDAARGCCRRSNVALGRNPGAFTAGGFNLAGTFQPTEIKHLKMD